jgi:sugar phosphate isomerase/epimerase
LFFACPLGYNDRPAPSFMLVPWGRVPKKRCHRAGHEGSRGRTMVKLATKFAPEPAAFELAHQAGYRCAELWTDTAVLANWQSVVEQAAARPLEYVLHFPNRKDLGPETLEQAVQLSAALGCRAMVIHEPHHAKYADVLLGLDPNLCLAVENHRFDPAGFERWATQHDNLTLDVEHLWLFTLADAPLERLLETLSDFLERFGSKLRHVHLPGYLPGFDEHRPMYCAREMVLPVLSLLENSEFEGFAVSEVETEFQNPNDLRMDVLLFDTWQKQYAAGGIALGRHVGLSRRPIS